MWVMRQAGRYLPEYRAVREKVDFLTLCRTPELAAKVTLQPIDRFGFDAAILFSDIMMPLESMGVELQFNPGPVVQQPIRDAAAVARLHVPEAQAVAPFVNETVRLLRRELKVPLIGFAGAPLTLAAYLVEGRGSKDFSKLRAFLYAQPDAALALMDVLAECMLRYLRAQVEAGAQAVQLFDSWAGLLSLKDFRRFALPAVQKIMRGLAPLGVPRIYFAQDAAALMPALAEVEAEALGMDWRTSLSHARKVLADKFVLQGNLDPAALFAPVAEVKRAAKEVLTEGGKRHVFNLGHGILPETPIASVEALVEVVKG
jgi:uroporphyrinogen decarboxylase